MKEHFGLHMCGGTNPSDLCCDVWFPSCGWRSDSSSLFHTDGSLSILTESVLDLKLMEEGTEAEDAVACREGETARKFLIEGQRLRQQ